MIRRWLVRTRETAGEDYQLARQAVHALTGTPLAPHADEYLRVTRHRLRLADLALDLWTLGGRC